MTDGLLAKLPAVVLALGVLLLTVLAARRMRPERGRAAQSGVLLAGVVAALVIGLLPVPPGQLLVVLGIGSVAAAFAFRDILQSFLAGIVLLLTEPFQIGDQIVAGGFEGTVVEIRARATLLRAYDGRLVVIPNVALVTGAVTIDTAFDRRRLEYDVGIGYGDDIERARLLMVDAMRSVEGVLADPTPEALVVELAPSSVNLRARWWIRTPRHGDALPSRDRVLTAIKRTLGMHGIDLPYPTQMVLFHDQTEDSDGDRARQREGWPAAPSARRTGIVGSIRRLADAVTHRQTDHPGSEGDAQTR